MATPQILEFPEAGEPNGADDTADTAVEGSEGGGACDDGGDGTVVTFLDAERD